MHTVLKNICLNAEAHFLFVLHTTLIYAEKQAVDRIAW